MGSGRQAVTLESILIFCMGASEEPVLGFSVNPSIQFAKEKIEVCAHLITKTKWTVVVTQFSQIELKNIGVMCASSYGFTTWLANIWLAMGASYIPSYSSIDPMQKEQETGNEYLKQLIF